MQREIKFRAWAKKTIDHYISDPINTAYKEYEKTEPKNRYGEEWDKWYSEREKKIQQSYSTMNPNAENRYETSYEMISDFSVKGNGKFTRPYGYEILDVMQYTGLKDKNGTEIYEGDIVKFEDTGEEGYEYKEGFDFENVAIVCFNEGRFEMNSFAVKDSGVEEEMDSQDELSTTFKNCEVIGNIYENPELLN